MAVLRAYLRRAALSVPDVKEVLSIRIVSVDQKTRVVTGDIQFTTKEDAANVTNRTEF